MAKVVLDSLVAAWAVDAGTGLARPEGTAPTEMPGVTGMERVVLSLTGFPSERFLRDLTQVRSMPKYGSRHLCACWDAAIFPLAIEEEYQLKFALFRADDHLVAPVWQHVGRANFGAERRLEVDMPVSRKEMRGGKVFAWPLFGIVFLLACYWVLADWQNLPTLIDGAIASVHWPR
jgi:hypothetical protein